MVNNQNNDKNQSYVFNLNECNIPGVQCFSEDGMGLKCKNFKVEFPPQMQTKQPGFEYLMVPRPIFDNPNYKASGKLKGKVAIITGGDSGLGRSIAVHFAKEGAKIVIAYFNEHEDANDTKKYIESLGGEVILISGDVKDENFCKKIVDVTLNNFNRVDILINNAGVQFQKKKLEDISSEQFDYTMKTNIYSIFYLTKASLPYMKEGASIINVSSITTFYGEPELMDYVTSKGAIVGFTRSLATNLASKNIRVNAVAPGFFWTPLQPACWEPCKIPVLAADCPMKRAGQPYEIAPLFVYLASDDSKFMTGQVLHINGGQYKG